jgi:galactokinase
VNLIGEHIDYHDLPVLPMAIGRRIVLVFRSRQDGQVRATSSLDSETRTFSLNAIEPSAPGDWNNYAKAAAKAIVKHWQVDSGIDAAIASDLPVAAGLSSSSALLTAFALALLWANRVEVSTQKLLQILPEAEHFVGTRGGGMDHAAILASQPGCALHVRFSPLRLSPVLIPTNWAFLVAHSMTEAAKSGTFREYYNLRREDGFHALQKLGFQSYCEALKTGSSISLQPLNESERDAFLHVTTEAVRVQHAVEAMGTKDPVVFGRLLDESHASLRDRLKVSTPDIDRLVETAREAGAMGARLTGAGFGGCVVILCRSGDLETMRKRLEESYYAGFPEFRPRKHLFEVEPVGGVLAEQYDFGPPG